MQKKFIKLLITLFGVLTMYLVAVGSGSSGINYYYRYPYGSADGSEICDNFIITKYWYSDDHKAMSYGLQPGLGWTCFSSTGYKSNQEAVSSTLAHCEKEATYCKIMAIGHSMYGPTKWKTPSENNQNYSGQNKVCNATVPGGCVVQ